MLPSGRVVRVEASVQLPISWSLRSSCWATAGPVIFRDNYFVTFNPIPRFEDRFQSAAEFTTPLGSLSIYRQR